MRRAVTAGTLTATGPALSGAIRALWASKLGYEAEGEGTVPARPAEGRAGDEARERTAALDTLIDILSTQLGSDGGLDAAGYLAELDRRRAGERAGSADGVNLLTYHRAKGLEWDAVALPMLEDGSLPIRQAFDDDALLDEERRLLYVGLTRARVHLLDLVGRRARDPRPDHPPPAQPVPRGPAATARAARDAAPGPVRGRTTEAPVSPSRDLGRRGSRSTTTR